MECDWYSIGIHKGLSPKIWADNVASFVVKHNPEVFILNKGWHDSWCVAVECLWWMKRRGIKMVYINWDDPASTPITLRSGIVTPMDLWLTTCRGIPDLFRGMWRANTKAKCVEFWLAHDSKKFPTPVDKENIFAVDVAITGSPYHRPFPAPHYQHGFGSPRADIVRALLKHKVKVGIWGPDTWLDNQKGGDGSFKKIFHGWLPPGHIHRVHRSAKISIGTHLVEGLRYESGRFPFVGGAGGCLVHEIRPGLREEFGDRAGWFRHGSIESMLETTLRLLKNEKERDRMSISLHKYIMLRHTWVNRAQTLSKEIQALLKKEQGKK